MTLMRFLARGLTLCLLLAATGCAITRPPGGGPVPVEEEPDYTTVTPPATAPQPPPVSAEPPSTSAWRPLVDKAGRATARGDYEQALALLERAQRIDPDSGEIYLQLAKTHQAKGDLAQARATAERGLLYCIGKAQCKALRAYAH